MHIKLPCDRCGCRFTCPEDAPAADVLERITAEGPWFALGDGATVEDRLFADLSAQDEVCCPRCGTEVAWSEESLGRLSQQLLGQW